MHEFQKNNYHTITENIWYASLKKNAINEIIIIQQEIKNNKKNKKFIIIIIP